MVAQGVQPGTASARAVHFASQVRLLQLAGQLMHFAMAGVDGAKRGQMAVTVCPYFAVAPQEPEGTDLVTEADVLDAAKTESKTIRCRHGAIITPAARDALAATDVILRYEGETTHAAS